MGTLEVIDKLPAVRGRLDVRELLAFGAIYFLWGATFLAIRIAVLEIPPFFTAGLRFFVAGSFLYLVLRLSGEPAPSTVQWRGIAVIASVMFVVTYGALFWVSDAQPRAAFAWGHGGQFVYVVPSLELVVVATTDWRNLAGRRLASALGMQEALADHWDRPARSFPAAFPLLRLDRIYVRGFQVGRTEAHRGRAWARLSDHAALSAHLQLADRPA